MQQVEKEILQKFGEEIKRLRKSQSSSLNKFSFERGGITSASLSRIENGLVDFKFTTLVKLAYALNISLSELFESFDYEYTIDD